ncbi:MAG: enolase C-terminal domain-like protein [Actinomycetota bacterium]
MPKVIGFHTVDVRFPTSRGLDGSDAMNQDPDYSAAYLILETDDHGLSGHSLVFTIGRGNDLQCSAIDLLARYAVGRDIDDLARSMGDFARSLVRDSQMRWLGPEKGVTHMAAGAVINAAWDLISKRVGKPLWKVLSELSPAEIVDLVDFRYLSDAITKSEALEILKKAEKNRATNEAALLQYGLPAYTTTPGWLGYSDEKMVRLAKEAVAEGFTLIKLKCGVSLEDDKRRLKLVREAIGPDVRLAIDANQVWDVPQAIEWINSLGDVNLHWVEEPTSPDDILGHAAIAEAIAPVRVATGEHVANRIIFKQMLQARSLSFLQIDASRVAGVNENIAMLLMAAKYGVPVCPHAGGVGLCEMVQHLAMFDFVAVGGEHPDRVVEFVDHLHEHFVVPTRIENARYMPPTQPGAGAEMFADSITEYAYPTGKAWVNA